MDPGPNDAAVYAVYKPVVMTRSTPVVDAATLVWVVNHSQLPVGRSQVVALAVWGNLRPQQLAEDVVP